MTVNQKAMRKVISGTGWSNPLMHNVYLEAAAHLKVYSDGTLLVLGDDYTVEELQNEAGYEVHIAEFAPGMEPVWYTPDVWVLSVEPPIEQPADLSLGGQYGVRFEDALDRLARRLQVVYDMALRAIKSPRTTDPATLDQDDLVVDPDDIASIAEGAAAAIAAADAAEADAEQTALDRIATAADRVQTGADRSAVASDKATVASNASTVAADKVTVAADKATVAADKAIVAGYRDEVEDDRIDVQNDKVIASQAADDAAAALALTEAARDATLAAFDSFDDRYLGAKTSDPTLDNDGNALVAGSIYFNSVAGEMRVYTGTVWAAAYVDGATVLLKSQNLNDLPNKATARNNLDVYSKAQVDAYAGAAAGKTTPVDADGLAIVDSADSSKQKLLTFANLKTWLQAFAWTMTQKLTLVASTTGAASLNIPHGTAPTSPVNGDIWTTSTGGFFWRRNGGTRTGMALEEAQTVSGAKTHTGKVNTAASATGGAGFLIAHGAAPTSPVDGDIWTTTAGLFARINAATRTFLHGADIGVSIMAFDAQLFSNIPVNSQSAAYTLVSTDASKMIYHPAADTTARIWTIPANSSVAFPVGTVVTFDNDFGAGAITIAINTDTLVLVGAAGSTGSRTLASGGRATATKVSATRWRISGTGLT